MGEGKSLENQRAMLAREGLRTAASRGALAAARIRVIMVDCPAQEIFMHVVITGGAGFLGSRLARALLARGSLTLTDTFGHTRGLFISGLRAEPRTIFPLRSLPSHSKMTSLGALAAAAVAMGFCGELC